MKIALIGTTAESLIQFRKELINLLHKNGHVVYAFAIDYDDVTKEKLNHLALYQYIIVSVVQG
ncbi:glycosyl transferase group 1 domain protein [Escherichia coli G58-1]|nr:glycosyl transferase group 1 domain protein [Escherichia coli G58-1]